MQFGWINLFGGIIVAIMLIPNIIYAIKNKDGKNLCQNKLVNLLEQVGRYGCIILMWLPLLVWKFGFSSDIEALIYIFGNAYFLLLYMIIYALYFKKKTRIRALLLAAIPSSVFLLSGFMLRHWLLVAFAFVFSYAHIYVTSINNPKNKGTE